MFSSWFCTPDQRKVVHRCLVSSKVGSLVLWLAERPEKTCGDCDFQAECLIENSFNQNGRPSSALMRVPFNGTDFRSQ